MQDDNPLEPNPYLALNVPADATLATIRQAHRKLVLACHPDKVKDESAKAAASEQFHHVQQAYEILSDDTRRRDWEDRAKKAALEAEMQKLRAERRPSVPTRYASSRYEPPIVEVRSNVVYEDRAPKNTRAYEEDYFSTKFASPRPSAKVFDERYADLPSPRRASGRMPDDRRRASEADVRADARLEKKAYEKKMREREAAQREEKNRKRDKDRRRDSQAKFRTRAAYVEDDSSDSDAGDRYYKDSRPSRSEEPDSPPKPPLRRSRESDQQRRPSKVDKEYDLELDRKLYGAQDYIRKAETVEPEPRRPGRNRPSAQSERRTPVLSSSPPTIPVDTGRRSSADDGRRSSGKGRGSRAVSPTSKGARSKRVTEVGDPAPSSSRKPSMPAASSDPKGLKKIFSSKSRGEGRGEPRGEPARSATYNSPKEKERPFRHPGIRRAETMPVHGMRRSDPVPAKSSNLKQAVSENSSSSDSSDSSDSDATPMPRSIPPSTRPSPPRHRSTQYKIHDDDFDDAPRSFVLEPEEYMPRSSRDGSPKGPRRSSERPSLPHRGAYSTTRTPPMARASSHAYDERPHPRPNMSRGESARAPPPLQKRSSSRKDSGQLYGEYSGGSSTSVNNLSSSGGGTTSSSSINNIPTPGAPSNNSNPNLANPVAAAAAMSEDYLASPKSHHGSPRMGYEDAKYAASPKQYHSRRGSDDVTDHDAYPGSNYNSRRTTGQRSEIYAS